MPGKIGSVGRPASLLGAVLLSAIWTAPASAAPGDLDSAFSSDGWVRTLEVRSETNNYLPEGAEDLAIQPDGKIVAVGELEDGTSNWYFGAFRYLPSGGLDETFGEGGWVDTDLGSFEFAHAVALQGDGKIVVAGEGDCELATCFVIVRYKADGSLDSAFGGGDGVVRTMFRQCGCWALDVAIQPNGKIVAAGWRFRYGDALDDDLFAVARYLPDGALDRTFSGDGRVSVDLGFGDDIAHSVAVLPGGKVLVAGQGTRNRYLTEDDFALARFRNDGTLDPGFSGDGLRTINFGRQRYDIAYSLDVQDDGRILVAGTTSDELEAHPRLAVARLNPGGSLDRSFGRDGLIRFRPGPYGGYARTMVQHPDGRVVVAGRRFVDAVHDSSDWIVLRYLRNGTPDPSFGGDGMVVTDFGTGADRAGGITIDADGKIVVGGWIYESLGLARYLTR
jgi:uncharacterized delta-60 repeat protein